MPELTEILNPETELLNDLGEVVTGADPGDGLMDDAAPASNLRIALGPLTRDEMLERSQSWIDEDVPYSQTKWHENQFGSYRQDCSGFVSMCWALDLSYTTDSLKTQFQRLGSTQELEPGDALWYRKPAKGHIGLFVRWADASQTKPVVREEFDFGHDCAERVWTAARMAEFSPVRSNNLGGGEVLPAFRTRGSGVRIRKEPNTSSQVVTQLAGPTTVGVKCQTRGQSVTHDGITRDIWAFIPSLRGYVTSIFIEGSPESLPGVPMCP